VIWPIRSLTRAPLCVTISGPYIDEKEGYEDGN
jgi:hypothetical protein